MSEPSSSDPRSTAGSGARRGFAWIGSGARRVQEQKPLWFGMTAVYFALGFALKLIPFMGDLLLILITPMLLAGVVWGRAQENHAGHSPAPRGGSSASALFQTWIAQPAQELARIFPQEEKVFSAVLLGIVTLGLTTLVKISGYLLVGGSMVSGLTAVHFNSLPSAILLGMLAVTALYAILAMGLFYSVPLTVLNNRQPLAAISESFSVCLKNAVPLLALTAPFFLVYLVIMMAFARSHWLGYLLTTTAGFAVAPVFVASVYGSYLALYPLSHSASRR